MALDEAETGAFEQRDEPTGAGHVLVRVVAEPAARAPIGFAATAAGASLADVPKWDEARRRFEVLFEPRHGVAKGSAILGLEEGERGTHEDEGAVRLTVGDAGELEADVADGFASGERSREVPAVVASEAPPA